MKRSAGYSLVNRGEAYWVKKPVLLKRLTERAAVAQPRPGSRTEPPVRAYIPETLPPAEVQGVTFDDPVDRAPGSLVFTRLWAERQEARV